MTGLSCWSATTRCSSRITRRLRHLLAEAPEGFPYPGAKPQKILDVEDRVLTAQVLEILERVTPVSRRRTQKTCGTL